jgi:S-phase kinase-associated protein 1
MASDGSDVSETCTLVSNDGGKFTLTENERKLSKFLTTMLEDCDDTEIPLEVDTDVLTKIVEYMKYHGEFEVPEIDKSSPDKLDKKVPEWDFEYINSLDVKDLKKLMVCVSTDCLHIPGIFDLCLAKVDDMITGKSPEEIREMFNIKNDWGPGEEESARKEQEDLFK